MIYASTSCLKGEKELFNRDVFKVLDVYKKVGIKNIELGSVHRIPFESNKLIKYQRENEANFIIHGFFPPAEKPFMLDLSAKDEKIIKESMNFIKNTLEFCRKIESRLFSFHGGFTAHIGLREEIIGVKVPYEVAFSKLVENTNLISDFAKENGVKIAIENNAYGSQTGILLTKEQIKTFFRILNDKNTGLLLDIGHLKFGSRLMSFDMKEFIEETQKWIFEIHCHHNDGSDDQHLNLKNTEILDMVDKDILKKAALTLEANNLTKEEIVKGVGILKKYL